MFRKYTLDNKVFTTCSYTTFDDGVFIKCGDGVFYRKEIIMKKYTNGKTAYMDMDDLAKILDVSKRNLISAYIKNPEQYPYVTRLDIGNGKYIVHPELLKEWLSDKFQNRVKRFDPEVIYEQQERTIQQLVEDYEDGKLSNELPN